MSQFEYEAGRRLAEADEPFYGLIQAAMRRADSQNAELLRAAWPEVWNELQRRYDAPGGRLIEDGVMDPRD